MSLSAVRHALAFSYAANLTRQLAPITSALVPLRVLNPDNYIIGFIKGIFAGNEFIYYLLPNKQIEMKKISKIFQLVHECNQLLLLAYFVASIFKAYQTTSIEPLHPFILCVPQILSAIHNSHPFFYTISQCFPTGPKEKSPDLNSLENQIKDMKKTQGPIVLDLRKNPSSCETVNELINTLTSMNEEGHRPYKILQLSVKNVMSYGKDWKNRLREVIDYVEIQGSVVLLVQQPESFFGYCKKKQEKFVQELFGITPGHIQLVFTTKDPSFHDLTSRIIMTGAPKNNLLPKKFENIPPLESPFENIPLLESQQEQAQEILESLGNQSEKNRVCLIGKEEKEKETLLAFLGHLLKKAKPPLEHHQIRSFHLMDLLTQNQHLNLPLIQLLKETHSVLYVHGIETGFQTSIKTDTILLPCLNNLLNYPDLKLIISTSKEKLANLKTHDPHFNDKFISHEITSLPTGEQRILFEAEKTRYNLAFSENLYDKLSSSQAFPPISHKLFLLGKLASIMTQRGLLEQEALEILKKTHRHLNIDAQSVL